MDPKKKQILEEIKKRLEKGEKISPDNIMDYMEHGLDWEDLEKSGINSADLSAAMEEMGVPRDSGRTSI